LLACICAGLADPVYAEAYVTVHQYDIVLDVTVINRTGETLQNVCLELATMGDLKLVERPQNYTLSPGANTTIRSTLLLCLNLLQLQQARSLMIGNSMRVYFCR